MLAAAAATLASLGPRRAASHVIHVSGPGGSYGDELHVPSEEERVDLRRRGVQPAVVQPKQEEALLMAVGVLGNARTDGTLPDRGGGDGNKWTGLVSDESQRCDASR